MTKRLIEGMERGEGKVSPDRDMPSDLKTRDPGLTSRRKTIVTCNGYKDPRDGRQKVAPGHKAKDTVFTQDAPQTNRCDACQAAYRSAYKMSWQSNKSAHGTKPPFA